MAQQDQKITLGLTEPKTGAGATALQSQQVLSPEEPGILRTAMTGGFKNILDSIEKSANIVRSLGGFVPVRKKKETDEEARARREKLSRIPTEIMAAPEKSSARIAAERALFAILAEPDDVAFEPSVMKEPSSVDPFTERSIELGAQLAPPIPFVGQAKQATKLSTRGAKLIEKFSKSVDDFSSTVQRPVIGVNKGDKLNVLEGTGRALRSSEDSVRAFVPADNIPTGAKIIRGDVPSDEVVGKNLVSSLGKDGANEPFVDLITKNRQFAEIEVPRGSIRTPLARPAEKSVLDEVDRILTPKTEKESFIDKVKKAPERLHTAFVSEFTPLRKAEETLYSLAGKELQGIDMARKFEQVAGARGKSTADIIDFKRSVLDKVGDNLEDFQRLLFLLRTEDRLITNPSVKKVADWTIEKARLGIQEMRDRIGDDVVDGLVRIAKTDYQNEMDKALRLQVQSGRMSQELYDAIKKENDFYAPFKVMRHIEDVDAIPGGGRSISTTKQLTQKITGIESEDFQLQDFLKSSMDQIYKARILAEKNLKMRELDSLADMDPDGLFVKRVKDGVKPRKGYDIVSVFKDGKKISLEVSDDIAEAVRGLNQPQAGLLAKMAAITQSGFRFGATTANLAFQVRNLFFADALRTALISKYGVKNVDDIIRFPAEFLYSFYTSLTGNFGKPNKLYMDFLKSGAANSTLQREFAREFDESFGITRTMADSMFGDRSASVLQKMKRAPGKALDTVADFANALEETSKILGYKRAMRLEGIDKLPAKEAAEKLDEIVTELRNFVGSPDFFRRGKHTRNMNLLFMFFNARLQGIASDLGRLTFAGKDKKASAVALARLTGAIGIPTLALSLLNQSEGYKEDYDQISESEKENYFMIPREEFFTTEDGQTVRDYWRIPKREAVKLFANMVEASTEFAKNKEPQALKEYASEFLENISPVNISGRNFKERLESLFGGMNPIIKAPMEYGLGRNTFFHIDTVPNSLKGVSPENQYRETTPEFFVALGKKVGLSPLQLEQLAQSFTGGFINQFTIGDPVEGRSRLSTLPITKIFFRTPFVRDAIIEDREEALLRNGDKNIELERSARQTLDSLRGASKEFIASKLLDLKNNDPELLDEVSNLMIDKERALPYQDRLLQRLPVGNGSRARQIYKELKEIDGAEKRAIFLKDLRDKKLLSNNVLLQLSILMKTNGESISK